MLRHKLAACLLLCAVLLTGCSEVQAPQTVEFATKPQPSYKTTEVIQDTFTLTAKASGNFVYLDVQPLVCEYANAIIAEDIYWAEQTVFSKGDVIAKITFDVSEAELERMELDYYQANRSAALQIESYESKIQQYAQAALTGGIEGQIAALRKERTENELKIYKEKIYASLSKQGEALEDYRDRFTDKELIAPEDCMVLSDVSLKAGTVLKEGATVLTYTTGNPKLLRLNNLHSEYLQLMSPGMKITITQNKKTYDGYVAASPTGISDTLDNQHVYIHSDSLDLLASRSYYNVECDILVLKDMLLVESKAIHYDGNTPYVMLLQDGQAVKKEIICGLESGKMTCVLDGLSVGQLIITNY